MATPRKRAYNQVGSSVVTAVIAIAILMTVFVGGTNLVLDEYAKGAVRTAVDDAAQAGATSGGSVSICLAEAAQVRADLLPGPFGANVTISCFVEGSEVVAAATGVLPSLMPAVPRADVSVVGLSVIEKAPQQ
jgi:hypothetical protein